MVSRVNFTGANGVWMTRQVAEMYERQVLAQGGGQKKKKGGGDADDGFW
jgi:hypothetical protein